MDAPEKVYLHPDIGGIEFTKSWSKRRVSQESVEYTRTDVFIEKALEWLCNNYEKYIIVIGSSIYPAYSDLCRDFQNDMKGE